VLGQWLTPSSIAATISKGQLTQRTATYTALGSLQVTIEPTAAVAVGARWSVDGGTTWRISGTSLTLPAGNYTVQFKGIADWDTPLPQSVTIIKGQTTAATGTYVRQTGTLVVTIAPSQAVASGAKWSVDYGTTWRSSATSLTLPTGNYTVQFKGISGWDTPTAQNVTIIKGQTPTATGTYVRHTGTLMVTVAPPEAATDGAQWSIDGGTTWRNSGTSPTLPTGGYTVTFKAVTHWLAPSSIAVTISKGQLTQRTATYIALGSLQVTIEPATAVASGAQWRRVGTTVWRNSGYTETNIPAGDYAVEFNDIAAWDKPSTRDVTLIKGQTTSISGTYVRQMGTVRVTIAPPEAVTDGAQWSIDGGIIWRESQTSLTLSTGDYTVQFKDIDGWDRPPVQIATVVKGQTIIIAGTYVRHMGTLTVTIAPAEAVAGGAQWSIDGGTTWLDSSATVALPVGSYTVRFKPVAGRATPADQTVTIIHGQTLPMVVYYNGLPTVTQVSIDPPYPGTLDTIQAIAKVTDPDGDAIVAYQYEWLCSGTVTSTAPTLAPQYTTKGQQWQVRVRPQDSVGDWGNRGATSFTIANTRPTRPIVEIHPRAPSPTSDLTVYFLEYSVDPDGDPIGYDFRWYVSRDNGQTWIHKVELDGSRQVSNSFVEEGDLWKVDCFAYEKTTPASAQVKADGTLSPVPMFVQSAPGWDQVYVGRNNLPQMQFTQLAGVCEPGGKVRLTIQWTWSDADGDTCTVQLYWTDHGAYGLNAVSGVVPARSLAYIAPVSIPKGVPVYIHGVIKDAKGAVTKITSGPIRMTQSPAAANPAWLRAE